MIDATPAIRPSAPFRECRNDEHDRAKTGVDANGVDIIECRYCGHVINDPVVVFLDVVAAPKPIGPVTITIGDTTFKGEPA